MKTIAIFSGYYFPHLGGVERYTYNLAKELHCMGYNIIIITSQYDIEQKNIEKTELAKIYRIPTYKVLVSRYPINKINKKSRNLFKNIKEENIDFAIVQTRFWAMSYIASKFIKKNNIKSLLIEHGSAHFTVNNKILDYFGAMYEHILTNSIKRRIKSYYGVSNKCVSWLKHFNIEANGVLYNSIDISIKKKYSKDIVKDNNKVKITFVGRMIEEKGVLKLIDAFKDLQKKYNNIELNLAGDGPILNKIIKENKNEDKINILGNLKHDDVLRLLCKTSIFVNPSDFSEGLPTTILEAGLLECAIIATPMGGTTEIISDDSLGLICTSKKEDIEESIELLLNDNSKMNLIGVNISKKIMNEFSWSTTAKKVKDIIEEN